MLKLIVVAALAVISVYAEGEIAVLHSPSSLEFTSGEPLRQSILKDVITAALGLTVQTNQEWDGMIIKDILSLPEAAVSIAIEGVDSFESSKTISYALNIDESEERTWQDVRQRLEDRDKNSTLIRIRVADGFDALGHSSLGELKLNDIERPPVHLKPTDEIDAQFIREVQLLHAIAQKVKSTVNPNNKPDIYWLIVSGLGRVLESHGKDSHASKEALKLLDDALVEIRKAFTTVYHDQAVIFAFTSLPNKVQHTRSIRQRRAITANATDATTDKNKAATESGVKPMSEVTDEDEMKFTEDEVSNNDTEERVESITEPYKIIENTEPPGHELNQLPSEVHSMTGGENPVKLVKISTMNLAKKYGRDYSAIFNIILWFGVIFVFSLLAICITIADMDPGRDSIIYRMTSNRMKKDN